jgi:hypothetical protein
MGRSPLRIEHRRAISRHVMAGSSCRGDDDLDLNQKVAALSGDQLVRRSHTNGRRSGTAPTLSFKPSVGAVLVVLAHCRQTCRDAPWRVSAPSRIRGDNRDVGANAPAQEKKGTESKAGKQAGGSNAPASRRRQAASKTVQKLNGFSKAQRGQATGQGRHRAPSGISVEAIRKPHSAPPATGPQAPGKTRQRTGGHTGTAPAATPISRPSRCAADRAAIASHSRRRLSPARSVDRADAGQPHTVFVYQLALNKAGNARWQISSQ